MLGNTKISVTTSRHGDLLTQIEELAEATDTLRNGSDEIKRFFDSVENARSLDGVKIVLSAGNTKIEINNTRY